MSIHYNNPAATLLGLLLADDSHTDPNDPRNADLMQLVDVSLPVLLDAASGHTRQSSTSNTVTTLASTPPPHLSLQTLPSDGDFPDYFRLSSLDNSARFVTDSAFSKNKRFQLLELRRKKVSWVDITCQWMPVSLE